MRDRSSSLPRALKMASASRDDELITFMKQNGLEPLTERFIVEKIDKSAVHLMSEKQLEELGITAMGDRLRIRAFWERSRHTVREQKSRQDTIEKMKSLLHHQQPSKRSHGRDSLGQKDAKTNKTLLKFEFGWKHWCPRTESYKQKKKTSGGGTRILEVHRDASVRDCLQLAKELFFPLGVSPEGKLEDMDISVGDFNGTCITNVIVDGEAVPFTAERYKQATGFTKPRLYVLTKEKMSFDSGEEEELLQPVFLPRDAEHDSNQSHLLGTSQEREKYRVQFDRNLAASLQQDRTKEEEKRKNEGARLSTINKEVMRAKEEGAKLESLRLSRSSRVLPEPQEGEIFALIKVRHTKIGLVSRRFPVDAAMWNVYDWVGSLQCTPKYFSLSKNPKEPISPSEGVHMANSHVLFMTEEVAFYSDGFCDQRLEKTLPDNRDEDHTSSGKKDEKQEDNRLVFRREEDKFPSHFSDPLYPVPPIEPELPNVILEGDEENNQAMETLYRKLQARRLEEEEKLDTNKLHIIVDKSNVVNQLLEMYSGDDAVSTSKLIVSFEGEESSGDGLLRELYSLFWESFISQNCDGSDHYTLRLAPHLSTEDFTALGRLISHMFIQCGTFPVKLAKAFIIQMLFGFVGNECLLDSFVLLLPPTERDMLSDVLRGKKPLPLEEVLEILEEYQERSLPTSSNLKEILVKIARAEFVTKPFLPILKIREGMGEFWDSVSQEEIESVYAMCTPSPSRAISLLHITPLNTQESKIARWLKRFLKEADSITLGLFLRFCTGNDMAIPGCQIKVRFENMVPLAMRPMARTCFRVLTLPRTYQTYHQLRENLDFFIKNTIHWDLED